MTREKEYVYKTTLREVYGLTDAMIRELGEPDRYVKNPHWKSGPPASLYAIERVEAWCDAHREQLDRAVEARDARRAAAQKGTATKLEALIQWANTVQIDIARPSSLEAAWQAAESHYALRDWGEVGNGGVTYGGLVAYLRHRWTNYEHLLKHLSGRVGAYDAYKIIRERVDQRVEECIATLHQQANEAQHEQDGPRGPGVHG